ncbi:hypothetical protein FRC03_002682 [Tulasnella sp. 419]|nr:hypothetical protein FRC03_002682 [Tulasnella sp. 419]
MPVDVARVSRVVNNVVSTASDVIRKHPIHYLDDLVILKIEETLFRVEKSLLCQFDAFRVMFESASEYLKDIDEGSTDKNPIILQGLTAVEMESLLRVINARWLKGVPEVDPQQWKAVIHLATMWEHEQLRQFAIDKIDELGLSSIELLALGTKCRVGKWLKPALVEMYLRPSPLGLDEAERLGISFFVELTKIREGCLTISSINSSCRTCGREYKGNRRSSSGDVHWPVGWGLSSPAHKRLRETRYCCCKNGWDPRKEATAQNMVQSLIDSGLQPFLEDAKSRNPGTFQHQLHTPY